MGMQWDNYEKAINNLVVNKESCLECSDPSSKAYKGPVSFRSGNCGRAKYLNLKGLNKFDYYPPQYCLPSVDDAPIIVENIYSSSPGAEPVFKIEYEKEKHRLSTVIDCGKQHCSEMEKYCDTTSFNYVVKSGGKNLYTIEVTG